MDLLRFGASRTFAGLRTGDSRLILLGGAALLLALYRRRDGRELIYRKRLSEGRGVVIRMAGPGTRPLDPSRMR